MIKFNGFVKYGRLECGRLVENDDGHCGTGSMCQFHRYNQTSSNGEELVYWSVDRWELNGYHS